MAFRTRRRWICVSISAFAAAVSVIASASSNLTTDVMTPSNWPQSTTPEARVTPTGPEPTPPPRNPKENQTLTTSNQYHKEDFFWGCNDDKICDVSCQAVDQSTTKLPVAVEAGFSERPPEPRTTATALDLQECRQQRKPEGCRCDYPKCLKYGDCCWTQLLDEQHGVSVRQNYQPALECRKMMGTVTNFDYAWTVTKCPKTAFADVAALCHADLNSKLYLNFSYLLDIPVYSLQSNMVYKNAYCAICHKENRTAMAEWRTELDCTFQLKDTTDRNNFKNNAIYDPESQSFEYNGTKCSLTIRDWNTLQDFYGNPVHVETLRNCVHQAVQVTSCRSSNATLWHDSILCNMYSQYVRINSIVYKNIHCAKCDGHAIQFSSSSDSEVTTPGDSADADDTTKIMVPQPSWCFKAPMTGNSRPTFTITGANYGGIHLLFDFSLGDSDHVVGLKAKCNEDEVWDYLHQRCQVGFCGPGYYFQDEVCLEIPNPDKLKGQVPDNNSSELPPEAANTTGLLPANCQRLHLYEGEWHFISVENGTIVVDLSSAQGNILHRDEYEFFNDTTLAICYEEDLSVRYEERFSRVLIYASRVCLGISVGFSLLHILIYSFVPKLRNLPGKILVCLTFCIFSSQLVFLTLIDHGKWPGLCVSISIFLHYAFLASFFWMNVMSFDIWRTFTGSMVFSRNQSRQGQQMTFLRYSLFAWTVPLLIVICAASVDFAPPFIWPELQTESWTKSWELPREWQQEQESIDDLLASGDNVVVANLSSSEESLENTKSTKQAFVTFLEKVKPSYGQDGVCWFSQRLSLFVFFALPVALVMASNLVLFGLTAKTIIIQHRTSGKVLNNEDSGRKKNISKKVSDGPQHDEINAKLYAKLALIMGLTWTLGYVSKLSGESWLWFMFVSLNGLQGTFIFFAFDFKVKIWEMLRERWNSVTKRNGRLQFRQRAGSDSTKTSQSISFGKTISTQTEKGRDNCAV